MRANESMKIQEPTAGLLEGQELKRAIVDFTSGASTEISTHDEDSLPTLATTLPAGTAVYVAHTPKAKLSDVVATAIKLQQLGFRASTHSQACSCTPQRNPRPPGDSVPRKHRASPNVGLRSKET